MKINGPVVLIDDDPTDQEIFKHAFQQLGYTNQLVILSDAEETLEYLQKPDIMPFIIISDINMPKINGFELRTEIRKDENLYVKCTPFLFFSTSSTPRTIMDAYAHSIQGFFKKEDTIPELVVTLKIIMEYWKKCLSPETRPY